MSHITNSGDLFPAEAFDTTSRRFNPKDDWIKSATQNVQIQAMRAWFLERYEDPAHHTPYIGSEGGYQYIHGGPYDPSEELQGRFGHLVDYKVIKKLVDELYSEVGDSWAPVEPDDIDYYAEFSMLVTHHSDPRRMLRERLQEIETLLNSAGIGEKSDFVMQLAHGAVITALESYLWDIASYWTDRDEKTLRDFVTNNKDFQTKTVPLSNIFERMDGLKNEVTVYLQDLIWHRLDKIKPMIEKGLSIKLPEIGELMKEVVIRHDIIHRGGRTKDGGKIYVPVEQVRNAARMVSDFVDEVELEIGKRYQIVVSDEEIPF